MHYSKLSSTTLTPTHFARLSTFTSRRLPLWDFLCHGRASSVASAPAPPTKHLRSSQPAPNETTNQLSHVPYTLTPTTPPTHCLDIAAHTICESVHILPLATCNSSKSLIKVFIRVCYLSIDHNTISQFCPCAALAQAEARGCDRCTPASDTTPPPSGAVV